MRVYPALILMSLRNAHGDGGYAANDGGILGISNFLHLAPRFWTWNQNQLAAVALTPGAYVFIAQLEKEDRAVVITMPLHLDLLLPGIDLNERARAHTGMQRVVLHADVAI